MTFSAYEGDFYNMLPLPKVTTINRVFQVADILAKQDSLQIQLIPL